MLNISPNTINDRLDRSKYQSLKNVEEKNSGKVLIKIMLWVLVGALVVAFLPWTQNINSKGNVTTLKPEHRPTTIHSVIGGQVDSWFVQEGDFVSKGDTILHISETKAEYFDPQLIERTGDQLRVKEFSVGAYKNKVISLESQIDALRETLLLKSQQAENKLRQAYLKVTSDSIEYHAAQLNFQIATLQYERFETLQRDGLKSKTDLENRALKLQKSQAELISKENKLLTSKNEVLNARVELGSIDAQYKDKITKAQSEKFTAMSNQYDAEATASKLNNQLTNYSMRNDLYYVLAPQSGYITKAIQSGIGETIKEGAEIVSIMPANYELAVQMYVNPIDLPLLETGQHVRIQFDGWPAIVFSGWPNSSYGTFGGSIFAIDNFISDNGKYRVLVMPFIEEGEWPEALRVGGGTNAMILLKDVPIWYEIWRKINGFPPNYYKSEVTNTKKT